MERSYQLMRSDCRLYFDFNAGVALFECVKTRGGQCAFIHSLI